MVSMDSPGDKVLQSLAAALAERLVDAGEMLSTAESCTGGWVAKICTDLPGSSAWFERGFVTYTNEAKQEMLCVSSETLARYGAVSEQTVAEMATGALARSRAQLSLSISGIAGPGGASAEKPLGTVCFAWARRGGAVTSERQRFDGDREQVRRQAVAHALKGALEQLDG
jgi:nicotinamide-nucleotide amidase